MKNRTDRTEINFLKFMDRNGFYCYIRYYYLVAESAAIEMAFPDVCLEVSKSGSPKF